MLETFKQCLNSILFACIALVHGVIDQYHYAGIALLMAVESANIPLPSELILPYAGYMVQQGHLNFHLAALAGAVGCVLGSLPSYWLGQWGGKPFLQRYGRWLLLSEHDLQQAEAWSQRYGVWAFFICRMLPVVRTFISLPAGILRAPLGSFTLLTFIGSLVWSYALVYVGVLFGRNLTLFRHYWHQFDFIILLALFAGGCWYLWRHLKK